MNEMNDAQAWLERIERGLHEATVAASCMTCHRRIRQKRQRKHVAYCACPDQPVYSWEEILEAHGLTEIADKIEIRTGQLNLQRLPA